MRSPLETVQLLVAPVVMISASGLICLALYNRLAAIVSRARTFHKERFDGLTALSSLPLEQQTATRAHGLRARVAALEEQATIILGRARLIRNALVFLLTGVLCMLGCSLALGATLLWAGVDWLPLGVFLMGVVFMIVGVALALAELRQALEPVTAEGFTLEDRDHGS